MTTQQHNLHRIFTFNKSPHFDNKLINKNIPGLAVDDKNNIAECRDSQTEQSIVKSQNPFNNQNCLPYFEIEVLGIAPQDTINVGLIAKDNTNKLTIGKSNNSFGYIKSQLYLNKRKVGSINPHEKLKIGDYLGIGVNCHQRTFLVVKNNKVVSNTISVPQNWHEYVPSVGVSHQDQKIKVKYSPKDFKFNYYALVNQIQQQIEQQIKKEQINSTQIYPLVCQYLQFNGYTETLTKLQEKQKDMAKVPKFTKDPSQSRPTLTLERKNSQRMISQDQDMNQPLKFRNRIMSQRLDDQPMIPQSARRKNTQMNAEPSRKDSYLSNISNISNFSQSQDNLYQAEIQPQFTFEANQRGKGKAESLTQNQKFLLNEKIEIIDLIRKQQIEKALLLMEKVIPQFLQESYIVAFMKAHIFLKIVKTESNIAGIKYSRQQSSTFQNHLGTLFPFYDSEQDKVLWKPLKNIYTAMTFNIKNSNKACDMVSDKQFQTFASYINSLIMKKMGYLGCSRLSLCLHNTTKVMQKLKSFKGHNCGIDLSI